MTKSARGSKKKSSTLTRPSTFQPRPKDAAKIREQMRDLRNKEILLANELLGKQTHEMRSAAMLSSRELGQQAIRSLILLNGGAIIVLLAFVGNTIGKGGDAATMGIVMAREALPAFYWFVGGLVLATLVSATGYLNWLIAADSFMSEVDLFFFVQRLPPSPERDLSWRIKLTFVLAGVLGLLSLAAFCVGSILVVRRFAAVL
jgi:hypothetical protein